MAALVCSDRNESSGAKGLTSAIRIVASSGAVDGLDVFLRLLAALGDRHPSIEGGQHVGRGHRRAVVEADALAQTDRIDAAVAGYLGIGGGEKRPDAPAFAPGVERLEHVLADHADDIGRAVHRIEGRRLADRRNVGDAPALGLRQGRPDRQGRRGIAPARMPKSRRVRPAPIEAGYVCFASLMGISPHHARMPPSRSTLGDFAALPRASACQFLSPDEGAGRVPICAGRGGIHRSPAGNSAVGRSLSSTCARITRRSNSPRRRFLPPHDMERRVATGR